MIKPNWLKDASAKEDGFYSPKGEKLKNQRLSPDFIEQWNGGIVYKPQKEIKVTFDSSTVTGISVTEVEVETPDVHSMTKKELVEYASGLNIVVNARDKKEDILKTIVSVL